MSEAVAIEALLDVDSEVDSMVVSCNLLSITVSVVPVPLHEKLFSKDFPIDPNRAMVRICSRNA